MSYYFEISKTNKDAMQGFTAAENRFNAVQTLDNRWVCDINSLDEFENLFTGVSVTLVQLSPADFPQKSGPVF